jgi:hypothetical protein
MALIDETMKKYARGAAQGRQPPLRTLQGYVALTSILRSFVPVLAAFGSVTFRTPFAKAAAILSASM